MASLVAPELDSPLHPKSLGEEIVEVLQREIIAGDFRPGQRLVEREMIKRFGVSSIPIPRRPIKPMEPSLPSPSLTWFHGEPGVHCTEGSTS